MHPDPPRARARPPPRARVQRVLPAALSAGARGDDGAQQVTAPQAPAPGHLGPPRRAAMAAPPARPNVLFITADQLRADSLGCAGHPLVRTPHIDALASRGVHFANHFTQATPCGPSRNCIHTGMYLMNHRGVSNGTPLARRHTNWARELREHAGLRPALIGYTDAPTDPSGLPLDHPELQHWDGGYMEGFDNLTLHSDIGSAAWLEAEGFPREVVDAAAAAEAEGTVQWNGWRGSMGWLEFAAPGYTFGASHSFCCRGFSRHHYDLPLRVSLTDNLLRKHRQARGRLRPASSVQRGAVGHIPHVRHRH